jgi:hypothetical protein
MKGLGTLDGGIYTNIEKIGTSSAILAWAASPDRTRIDLNASISVLSDRVETGAPAERRDAARCLFDLYVLVIVDHYKDIRPNERAGPAEHVFYALKRASEDREIAALYELAGRIAPPDLKPTWDEVAARK